MSDQKRTVGTVTAASATAAALSTVLFWCIQTFTGVDVPAEVHGAVTVFFTLTGGYLVKPGTGKRKAAPTPRVKPGDNISTNNTGTRLSNTESLVPVLLHG